MARNTLQHRVETAVHRFGLKLPEKQAPASTIIPLALPDPIPLAAIDAVIHPARHLILPDTQCRPGVPLDHMRWAGLYACAKKPSVIVNLGDHWDMPSLCSYDKGKRSAENARYANDIKAGNAGMQLFLEPIFEEKERCMERGEEWDVRFVLTLGNHEHRIQRAIDDQPELEGTLGYDQLDTSGWEVHPFLEVVVVDGVAYSHFFTSGVMGKPVTSARALLTKKHQSCVMGHVQSYQTAMDYNAQGKRITGLFAGCYYQHEDGYRDKQSNAATWRGVHILFGVNNGEFTQNAIDLSYLKARYAGK